MKTFADFIAEAKKNKSDYSKIYAAKVAAVRERQNNFVNSQKQRTKQHLEREQEAKNRKKEEEEENQEYIKHIKDLKKEIKREVKREYGIDD